MTAYHLSRDIVIASCGASILACLLRIHRIYLVRRQGPGIGHATERLSTRYHYAFLIIVIVHSIISLGTIISFGVLALKREDWLMFASGSVILSSTAGQSCWRAGSWHAGQRSFHPGVSSCALVASIVAFLAGIGISEKWPKVGAVVLSVSASLFRSWMTWEWVTFIREKRGSVVRPGGNTFSNTPKIHQMLGHLAIQTVSMASMIVACTVAGTQLNAWGSSVSLKLRIISLTYGFHDALTEVWMLANQISGALYRWMMLDFKTSTDTVELVASRSDEEHPSHESSRN